MMLGRILDAVCGLQDHSAMLVGVTVTVTAIVGYLEIAAQTF